MAATLSSSLTTHPMMEINTTPLIDVMLVLLIMFIITIPHANPCGEARSSRDLRRPRP